MGCLHNKYTLPTFSHTHMHSPVHTHAQMLSHTHTLPHIHTLGAHKHSYTHTPSCCRSLSLKQAQLGDGRSFNLDKKCQFLN